MDSFFPYSALWEQLLMHSVYQMNRKWFWLSVPVVAGVSNGDSHDKAIGFKSSFMIKLKITEVWKIQYMNHVKIESYQWPQKGFSLAKLFSKIWQKVLFKDCIPNTRLCKHSKRSPAEQNKARDCQTDRYKVYTVLYSSIFFPKFCIIQLRSRQQ